MDGKKICVRKNREVEHEIQTFIFIVMSVREYSLMIVLVFTVYSGCMRLLSPLKSPFVFRSAPV